MQVNVLVCSDFSFHFLIDLFCNQKFPISHIFSDMFKENFLSHFFFFHRNSMKKEKRNFMYKLQFFFDLGDKIMILIQSINFINYCNQICMTSFSDYFFTLQIASKNIPFDLKLFVSFYKNKIKCMKRVITFDFCIDNRILSFMLFLFKKFKNSIHIFTENLNSDEDCFKFLFEWSCNIRKYDYWYKTKVFYSYSDYHSIKKDILKFSLTSKKLLKNSKQIFYYFKNSLIFKCHGYKLSKFFKKKFIYNYEEHIYNRIFHSFLNVKYLAFYKISKLLSKDMNLYMV